MDSKWKECIYIWIKTNTALFEKDSRGLSISYKDPKRLGWIKGWMMMNLLLLTLDLRPRPPISPTSLLPSAQSTMEAINQCKVDQQCHIVTDWSGAKDQTDQCEPAVVEVSVETNGPSSRQR